jgi:hypothetical protein
MRKTATALTDGARDVLERVEIVDQGAAVRLPDQLDRKLYVEVAEGLKRAGFVWDAWKMLRLGGRLVAIAPGMAPSGTLGKLCSEWTARIEPLPPASFHESGTDIHTCLLTVGNWGAL